MKAPLYTQDGKKSGDIELPAALFEAPVNSVLMHAALVRQHANARVPAAHTLKRDEVKGSTAKMYRQKGTGRARKGDRQNPMHRGGGVAWGPRNDRNWTRAMPKKQRRLALASSLSAKAKDSKVLALDKFELEAPKTKDFKKLVRSLPEHRSLLVVHNRNETITKSSRNLKYVKPLLVNLLNVHDLTKYDQVLFEKAALEEAEKLFKIEPSRRKVEKVSKVSKVDKVNKVEKVSKVKKAGKEPTTKTVPNTEDAGVV